MKCKGNIAQIYQDFRERKYMLTLSISDDIREEYERLKDKPLSIEIKQYRQKRSLTANAYYWQLLSKIGEVLGTPVSTLHNQNLIECGYIEIIDNKAVYVVMPETDEAIKKIEEYEHIHLKPTSQVKEGKDSVLYRTYMLLRGSHTFDSKEFSRLVDVCVYNAKQLGIETLPPDELERMMVEYAKKRDS